MSARRPFLAGFACLAALALALSTPAHADDGARIALTPLPRHAQECGACHLAFAPGLLPASSWQRLMAGLDRHFGSDASLDAASAREIGAWLQANAGSWRRVQREGPPPDDRITRAAWFQREHREVPAPTWRRPAIGSPSRCAACHPRAEQGSFDEREFRIPR